MNLLKDFLVREGFKKVTIPGLGDMVYQKKLNSEISIAVAFVPYERTWIIGLGMNSRTLLMDRMQTPAAVEAKYIDLLRLADGFRENEEDA